MKIATKIYLISAGAAALIVGDAVVDITRWNTWKAEQSARRNLWDAQSSTLRAAAAECSALAESLRQPPTPGTRAWDELGTAGARANALLEHTIETLKIRGETIEAPARRPLDKVAESLERDAAAFERDWRQFRNLGATEESRRVATRILLPALDEDLGDLLRAAQQATAEQSKRHGGQIAAQVQAEQIRQLVTSFVMLTALAASLYAIHRHFLRPLRRIEGEARSVNRGERLHVGFTYTGDDELGAVARAVNDAIDKLRSAAFSREELERQVATRTLELRERERELHDSRAQLHRALAGSQLCTWEWNVQTDKLEVQALFTEILGYAPGEFESTREAALSIAHPLDRPSVSAALQAHLDGATPRYEAELRFRDKSGEWRWVRSIGRVVERDAAGKPLRIAGTHADIHSRKMTELNLQRRDEQLRLALAASGSALWDADLRDRTVFLDERWAQFIGAPPGETRIVLKDLLAKVPDEEQPIVLGALERVEFGQTDEYLVEHRYRRDDGRLVWVRSRGRCIERDASSRALRIIGINVDLTAVKSSELAAARQAELYAAVNETAFDLLARRGTAAVLQGIADRAAVLLDAPSVEVSLIESELLVPRAWCGAVPADGLKPAGREAVLAWKAIDSHQPAVSQHYETMPGAVAAYSAAGVRAAAVFPIRGDDRALGVLGVCRSRPDHPFTPDDLERGRLLAQLAALALRNATIYEDAVHEAEAKTSALRESEKLYRNLVETVTQGYYIANHRSQFIYCNPALLAMGDFTFAELKGKSCFRLVAPGARAAIMERYEKWLADPSVKTATCEFPVTPKSGQTFWVEQTTDFIRNENGVAIEGRNMLRDISERRRAEQAMRESEARFHAVFEESPVMMFLLSYPAGRITEVNTAAEKGFLISRAEMLGRTTTELLAWADMADRDRYLRQLQSERHVASFETRMRRHNGELFSALLSGSVIAIGGEHYTLNSVQDITAQRQAETRLRQAQKMESLGTLAGGIAHDFNNLLTGILGSAELVRLELPEPHPAHRWLENIANGGARAKRLVQQILTFSRRSEGERGPVDLLRVVEEALRLLGSTLPPMVQLEAQLDRTCPRVQGDATQLHQVTMNLCTNAWQALPPEGGRVTIALEPRVVTPEQQLANPELPVGRVVVLTVADNGCGIEPDVLPRIFDPFFTTKEGRGTGLGLAVVHGIVRDCGGAVLVQSTPHAGTRFELYFRALAEEQLQIPETIVAGAGELPRGKQQRILFVDDDPGPRTALAGMLQFLGYHVTALGTPAEALLKFSANPRGFDLLLADYAMPSITGLELARQIRAAHPTLPIVIISGHLEADQRAESSRLRIDAVVSKPPDMTGLAHTIARVLGAVV